MLRLLEAARVEAAGLELDGDALACLNVDRYEVVRLCLDGGYAPLESVVVKLWVGVGLVLW